MLPSHRALADSPTRRERRRQRTRRDLAEAAVRLFQEYGYAGTKVDAIAEAAHVSESTFFRLFPRKEDVIFYDLPERLQAMREEFASSAHPTAWETIRSTFIANARTWDQDDNEFGLARAKLFHAEPALNARYLEMCMDWEDAVAEIVAAERVADPQSDLYSRLVATATVSAFRAAFMARVNGHGQSIAEHIEHAFDILDGGFGTATDQKSRACGD